ncbi:MAG: pyridoxal phosphate-dependent aminotransferase [Clostridia bacterium]|nr:pyridoxal phosphate-dependent aminotransferase [Clostridia bacterium]
MLNQKYLNLGVRRSDIRELFEYAKALKAEIGEENVFDFSLGNPSIAPPNSVNESIKSMVDSVNATTLHGYTSAQGDFNVRKAISDSIKQKFDFFMPTDNIYMTCGAAASLTITLCALCQAGDTVLGFKPYFPEYAVFTQTSGATFIPVDGDKGLDIDLVNFEKSINKSVKAVIINSPNNPSGKIYSLEKLNALAQILYKKSKELGHPIYLISDEPYREISYGKEVPYIPAIYDNTIVCYSFSKSLSLPGERIGYIAVSPKAYDSQNVYYAIMGAGRALGYVCAPSLFQRVIADNLFAVAAVELYKKNRDALCDGLKKLGYTFINPDGAFYLLLKAPDGNGKNLSDLAKKHNIIMPSGESFGAPEYVRISYCVSYDTIINSMPAFKTLLEEYK